MQHAPRVTFIYTDDDVRTVEGQSFVKFGIDDSPRVFVSEEDLPNKSVSEGDEVVAASESGNVIASFEIDLVEDACIGYLGLNYRSFSP